jgi:hypothetical protein
MVQRVDALVDIIDVGLSPVPARNGVTFESILNVSQSANVCHNPYRTSLGATHLVISLTGLDDGGGMHDCGSDWCVERLIEEDQG